MANTTLTWAALVHACNRASTVLAETDRVLFAPDVTEESIGLRDYIENEAGENELYCLIPKKLNETVVANGASVWVTAHDETEIQLSFTRTWVVADDWRLRNMGIPAPTPCVDCGGDKRGIWVPIGTTSMGSWRSCGRCKGSGVEPPQQEEKDES